MLLSGRAWTSYADRPTFRRRARAWTARAGPAWEACSHRHRELSPARVRGHRLRGSNPQGTSRNRAGRADAINRLPHRQRCAAPDTVQALQRAGCAGRPASCGRRRCLRRCIAMRLARNAGRTLEVGRQAFGNHGLLQLGCGIRNPGRLAYGARSTSQRLKWRLRNAGTGCGKGGMAFLSGGGSLATHARQATPARE